MNAFKSENVPESGESSTRPAKSPARRREYRLDDTDRTILRALRANARVPYADLARLVGLSAPSVTDRVKRLEQLGVITGYHAAVAPAAFGASVVALVGLEQSDEADQDAIASALELLPEIEDCWFVAGDEVYVVKVRVADMPGLEATLGSLRRVPGVGRTHTTVVLSTKWEGRAPDGPAVQAEPEVKAESSS